MITTPRFKLPSNLPDKKVLPALFYRRDAENMYLLEAHDKIMADTEGRKVRTQALILRDLMEAEVKRLELREAIK